MPVKVFCFVYNKVYFTLLHKLQRYGNIIFIIGKTPTVSTTFCRNSCLLMRDRLTLKSRALVRTLIAKQRFVECAKIHAVVIVTSTLLVIVHRTLYFIKCFKVIVYLISPVIQKRPNRLHYTKFDLLKSVVLLVMSFSFVVLSVMSFRCLSNWVLPNFLLFSPTQKYV